MLEVFNKQRRKLRKKVRNQITFLNLFSALQVWSLGKVRNNLAGHLIKISQEFSKLFVNLNI